MERPIFQFTKAPPPSAPPPPLCLLPRDPGGTPLMQGCQSLELGLEEFIWPPQWARRLTQHAEWILSPTVPPATSLSMERRRPRLPCTFQMACWELPFQGCFAFWLLLDMPAPGRSDRAIISSREHCRFVSCLILPLTQHRVVTVSSRGRSPF